MSNRLMIVLTTLSLVGPSVASGALAAPHRGAGTPRHLTGANVSKQTIGALYASVGEFDQSSRSFGDDASAPRYHGGPKSPY